MEPLEPGDPRTLGRYRILARVGTGGMAAVYLGRSRGGRAVAVKVMRADFARDPEYRDRFRREVAATTAVGGGYSPPVLDADPDAATPWMATEFLPSVSLREAVEKLGPLPADSVRRLAAGLAEALAAIHRAGIVHLDVKPANVLLTADGPRLIDFGIAAGERPAGPAGSWGFMSPEQVAGDAGSPSDVYSLGATLEYALGGQEADDALRTLIEDCRRPDPSARPTAAGLTERLAPEAGGTEPPGTAWLPSQVTAVIDARASAADNPPTVPSPPPGRRRLLAGGAVAVAVALAGGAAAIRAAMSDERPPAPKGARKTSKALPAAPSAPSSVSTSTSPTPSASASASAKPVVVEFVITGDGPLTSLDYAVNGEFTSLDDVPLSWRKTVEVPRRSGSVDWRIRLTIASGKVRCRVLLDGAEVRDESHPVNLAFGYPYDVDTGGAHAISGPLPGSGG